MRFARAAAPGPARAHDHARGAVTLHTAAARLATVAWHNNVAGLTGAHPDHWVRNPYLWQLVEAGALTGKDRDEAARELRAQSRIAPSGGPHRNLHDHHQRRAAGGNAPARRGLDRRRTRRIAMGGHSRSNRTAPGPTHHSSAHPGGDRRSALRGRRTSTQNQTRRTRRVTTDEER